MVADSTSPRANDAITQADIHQTPADEQTSAAGRFFSAFADAAAAPLRGTELLVSPEKGTAQAPAPTDLSSRLGSMAGTSFDFVLSNLVLGRVCPGMSRFLRPAVIAGAMGTLSPTADNTLVSRLEQGSVAFGTGLVLGGADSSLRYMGYRSGLFSTEGSALSRGVLGTLAGTGSAAIAGIGNVQLTSLVDTGHAADWTTTGQETLTWAATGFVLGAGSEATSGLWARRSAGTPLTRDVKAGEQTAVEKPVNTSMPFNGGTVDLTHQSGQLTGVKTAMNGEVDRYALTAQGTWQKNYQPWQGTITAEADRVTISGADQHVQVFQNNGNVTSSYANGYRVEFGQTGRDVNLTHFRSASGTQVDFSKTALAGGQESATVKIGDETWTSEPYEAGTPNSIRKWTVSKPGQADRQEQASISYGPSFRDIYKPDHFEVRINTSNYRRTIQPDGTEEFVDYEATRPKPANFKAQVTPSGEQHVYHTLPDGSPQAMHRMFFENGREVSDFYHVNEDGSPRTFIMSGANDAPPMINMTRTAADGNTESTMIRNASADLQNDGRWLLHAGAPEPQLITGQVVFNPDFSVSIFEGQGAPGQGVPTMTFSRQPALPAGDPPLKFSERQA